MQIVSNGDNLHDMLILFSEKKKKKKKKKKNRKNVINMSSAELVKPLKHRSQAQQTTVRLHVSEKISLVFHVKSLPRQSLIFP